MSTSKAGIKFGIIVVLILLVTVLHYSTMYGELGHHIAHRELYFIPIILSSFWFGMAPGLAASAIISLIYAPHVYSYSEGNWIPVLFQVLIFNLVALILGYLVERGKRQQEQVLMVERSAALGLAATAVGHEMKDLLEALKSISPQISRPECPELNQDFQDELGRLEQMVDIISTFKSKEPMHLYSHNVNEIIQDRVSSLLSVARKAEVKLETDLDPKGCPCRVNVESLSRVIERVIQNAFEASSKGQVVYVRSRRRGDHCEIEITDHGQGIESENLPKIFKPFFTTKEKRDGLSLSASQRVIRDMGGAISVQSDYGHGATFLITIPRESQKKLSTVH